MVEPDPPVSGEPSQTISPLRSALHFAVPSHFRNPFGLTLRILRSGGPDGRAALFQAGLKLGLAPADIALAAATRATRAMPDEPTRPVLLITGPPRSGTTLLHQLLIRALPVAYITNLASLFSGVAAAGGFSLAAAIANDRVRTDSYYGRTRALSGPSDGLEFWDKWLGKDRRAIPRALLPGAAPAMRRFFAALELRTGRPVVAKNNNLLGSAQLVAEALPGARFICLRRDPLFLAQSLLSARRDIHGADDTPYGMDSNTLAHSADPVEDVCRQVEYYRDLEAQQVARLGPDRFHVLSYEDLCTDPTSTVRRIAREMLGLDAEVAEIAPLRVSAKCRLEPEVFERIRRRVGNLSA